ncbi:MAG: hypothetical protein ACI9R3_004009 [Verrucomicrobiales bacterium]|jgi:hypothetical protein
MEVRLIRDEQNQSQQVASACLLTADSAQAWVTEIVRWEHCQYTARLHILPDQLGALVVMSDHSQPPANARAIPYQNIGRLYFPLDARTHPPVSENDIDELIADGIALLHPVAGLVHFAPDDALPITAFLAPLEVSPLQWNHARPGNAPRPPLLSITLNPAHEVVESFLEESRGDIGRQSVTEAPSFPEEERQPMATRTSQALREQFYKALEKATGQNKSTAQQQENGSAKSGGFLNRLGEWASNRLAQIESNQKREMNRLLHLLRNDPDAGLRFAPPLSGRNHRGRADILSASLVERDTDFSLAGLGGGHAASPWQIDFQIYEQLRREYREAANRELRLARFRRAAYIFANLLEDHSAAASALSEGGHFREAAQLYRDHLNQPVSAAECFWEAGDLDNAEPLFIEHGKHERLGELYALVGRTDASRASYRRAADYAVQMKDYLKASRILVDELTEPDAAITILRNGWPFSEQGKECVREEFSLLSKSGQHSEATARLRALVHECPTHRHLGPPLIEVIGQVADSYPVVAVRNLAADMVRVETGKRIGQLSANEASRVLAVMRSLAPGDRLLLRDTQRFMTTRKQQLLPAPPRRQEGTVGVKLFNIISLPNDHQWLAAAPFPGGYYALGITGDDQLVLMRKIWLGRRLDIRWHFPFANRQCRLIPCPEKEGRRQLRVHIDCGHPLPEKSQPVKLTSGTNTATGILTTGTLNQTDKGSLGLTYAPTGEMWELSLENQEMVLKCYDAVDCRVLSTAHTASLFGADEGEAVHRRTGTVPMASIDSQVFFAFRSFICRYHKGDFAWLELPDAITDIQCGLSEGQPILAAALQSAGVAIISCGSLWGVWEHHAGDADSCHIRFLHDGMLAVANTRVLELYKIDTKAGETRRCAREPIKLPDLLSILPGNEPDVLALMTSLQSHYYRMIEPES